MTSANVSNLNTDSQMTPPRPGSSASTGLTGDSRAKAGGAISKVTEGAQQAAEEAKQSATTLAAEANDKVKSLLTEQVGVGADLIGHVAASAKVAAESLEPHSPQLASLVRGASERADEFSREIRGQTIEQIARRTSDFARARPAVMFGAAATCGFFLYRLFKAGSHGRPRPESQQSGGQDHRGWQIDGKSGGNRYPLTDDPRISAHYGQSHGA
jgi:ElaB/YqjD/DUF883 family membrane-anchored ribosome-binding protein